MPFTLAHPAAVIPLKKLSWGRDLVLSALVVGSMMPDFGYFVPATDFSGVSHSWWGILVFDVPVGLLILWIFHNLLKHPLMKLLPAHHRHRLQPYSDSFSFLPRQHFLMIVVSLWLGALTHIGWDSMTHGHGWVVQNVPFFRAKLLTLAGKDLIVYFVFKHSSTIFGLSLLLYWYRRWSSHRFISASLEPFASLWWKYLVMAIIFLLLAGVGGVILATLSLKVGYTLASQVVRWSIALLGIGGVVYSLALLARSRFTATE